MAIAFTVLVVAGILYLHFADLNWLKPRIELAVNQATGRELQLNGTFDLDIVPSPTIVLEDVRLSNAEWGSRPTLVTIGHFSVRLGFWSLVSGPLLAENLSVRDVDLLLETNEHNQANWEMGGPGEPESDMLSDSASGAGGGTPVIIESAELRNITLTYRAPGSEPLVVSLASLDISTDERHYNVLEGEGEVLSLPLRLAGKLGSTRSMAIGTGVDVNLDADLGILELSVDGSIEGGTDNMAELSVSANGSSLAALQPGLPDIPFSAVMAGSVARDHLVLDRIESSVGESDVTGSLDISMGDKIVVTGQFESRHLDLTPFAGESEEPENPEEHEAKPDATGEMSEEKFVFVEEPLPLEQLEKMEIDVDARVDRFTFDNIVLLDVFNAVNLKDGDLRIRTRYQGSEGGKAVSDIALTTAASTARLDVEINTRDLRVNLLSGDVSDAKLIPPVNVTVDLQGSGASPRGLAASAKGRVLVTQGAGQIQNNLVGAVSGDIVAQLFRALNPFAKDDKFTALDCTIVALDISDGRADIAALYSQGEKLQIIGDGDIDLTTEALNIEFNTKPRKGVGITPDMFITPFVKLVGTLSRPKIGADKKGALLAVATGGIAQVVTAITDRVSGERDRCASLLEEVGDHAPLED